MPNHEHDCCPKCNLSIVLSIIKKFCFWVVRQKLAKFSIGADHLQLTLHKYSATLSRNSRGDNLPSVLVFTSIIQVHLCLNHISCHSQNENFCFAFCYTFKLYCYIILSQMTPGNVFDMFHFWFGSPIFNNIPSRFKFCFAIKTQKI